ncbi:MAG: hypothetical protein Q4C58_14125 [Eubacteriales bacterium]|nr:hypothetical protein [Eubacteriales bacterium]
MTRKAVLGLILTGCLLAACGQAEENGWQDVNVSPEPVAAEENMQSGSDGGMEAEDIRDEACTDGTGDEQEAAGSRRIENQTFQLNLTPYGQVTFASYAPDTTANPNGDATFSILQDGRTVYTLPEVFEGNVCPGNPFYAVEAVSFPDINSDGYDDIIIICQYIRGAGPEVGMVFSEARIYMGSEDGTFFLQKELMDDANSALAVITVQTVLGFLGVGDAPAEAVKGTQTWQQAYIEQIKNDQMLECYGGYDLIYLDNDDIPELVEIGDYEAAGCRIVSFYEGEVTVTQLSRLNFSYIEKENLLCNSDGLMDSYYDLVYRLENGTMTLIAEGYYGAEDNSNVQFDETGEPIYQYSWNGKEMSEEEYEQALNAVYDRKRAKSYAYPGDSAEEMLEKIFWREEANKQAQ